MKLSITVACVLASGLAWSSANNDHLFRVSEDPAFTQEIEITPQSRRFRRFDPDAALEIQRMLKENEEARRAQQSPSSRAADAAVQAALLHARKNGGILPPLLVADEIQQVATSVFDSVVPVSKVVYIPPSDRRLAKTNAEIILVMVSAEDGIYLGHAAGHVTFASYNAGVNSKEAQPGDAENGGKPPGDERKP